MKAINKFLIVLLLIISIACTSDETADESSADDEPISGNTIVNFNASVGDEDLALNSNTYNKNGSENFSVEEFKYIISNIVLVDVEGNEFVYPQEDSYFLINQEIIESQSITLQNIDANNYTSIRFGIGVDQSQYPLNGVDNFVPTAEDNDMLWSWSAGYIFMKIEGMYSSEQSTDASFIYHIGSHGENLDNYREVSLDFLQPIAVNESETPEVNINLDVLKIFSGPYDMLLEEKDDIQIDPENAPKIIENFSQAFEIGLN